MKTNLIIVEGLPGSGKSTTAATIADELNKKGKKVICVDEGVQDQPDVKEAIDRVLDERGNDWLNAVIDYHTSQGYGKQNGLSGYEGYIQCLEERKSRELRILRALDIDYYTVSQDMKTEELAELFASAGRSCPEGEQIDLAIHNSTKSFVVRHREKAVATINWLGDYGMHWFMKEFIVRREFQGKMIGTFLYRFSENFIKSTLKEKWKVRIDLRASKGKENFYHSLGFQTMSENGTGSGMEKMIEGY